MSFILFYFHCWAWQKWKNVGHKFIFSTIESCFGKDDMLSGTGFFVPDKGNSNWARYFAKTKPVCVKHGFFKKLNQIPTPLWDLLYSSSFFMGLGIYFGKNPS